MLEEAVEVIRLLWQGGTRSHRGRHYRVEQARIYTLPEEAPPILVAGSGPKSARLAGRIGDGFVSLTPKRELVESFEAAGGAGKPRYAQVEVCFDEDEARARRTAHEWWPNTALGGELSQELKLPAHFEQAAANVSEDDVAEKVTCGPDANRHVEAVKPFLEAGYDHVYFHQIGPDQDAFLRFYSEDVLPRLRELVPQPA